MIHQVLLAEAYEASAHLWRPESEMTSKMWIIATVDLLWSCIFVYLFQLIAKGAGVAEGVRYGFCIGLFVAVPMAYNTYTVMPIDHS